MEIHLLFFLLYHVAVDKLDWDLFPFPFSADFSIINVSTTLETARANFVIDDIALRYTSVASIHKARFVSCDDLC